MVVLHLEERQIKLEGKRGNRDRCITVFPNKLNLD